MNKEGFNKLYWGFLFIMFDFRLAGFDILPDIVGYILFAMGFGLLIESSFQFSKAKKYNFILIFLSLFQIYEPQVQQQTGINLGYYGAFGIIVGIGAFVLGLLTIYHLFMGIKEMAEQAGEESVFDDIYAEADKRWNQYLVLSIASLAGFVVMFIPVINLFYIMGILIASIALMVAFMKFMKKCSYNF
ncbi:hypothetical protein [Serpentinicella alkaliphila]|uniref:Uncharacterized protein n=1 Tax=Serpentinicella alkaliphila TaxID=1734049 RepID=A0A4R2TKX3_9FIRM|nr:hypothetical protein [Serpentinicella alkaliphila]QUH24667.1 hypothetical protein HZR23_01900 [Serpentinicella alkaliphila]TCQ03072.1 hypothetical protein EDD79_101135 [Serpentinicella alkaliphila]